MISDASVAPDGVVPRCTRQAPAADPDRLRVAYTASAANSIACCSAFDALITRAGDDDGAEVVRFPSLLPRTDLEHSGYLKSFPQLVGARSLVRGR